MPGAALALAARRGAALLAAGHAGRRFRRMDERAAGRSAVHAGRRRDLRRAVDGAPGLLPGDRRTGLCVALLGLAAHWFSAVPSSTACCGRPGC
ncbi:hypothetical protein ACPA9J_06370 [Pseudomonas aeruginosa]